MVTSNRRFSIPHGYSRRAGKRDVERLLAEELEVEPINRLPRADGTGPLPGSRVALELEPRVVPHNGIDLRGIDLRAIDLRAVTRPAARPGPTMPELLRRLGLQLLHVARRQSQRLFRWISWR